MEKLSQFITHHALLWGALIGILLLILLNELFAQKKKAKELSPQALIDKINQDEAVLIDIRDKETFNKAHIIHSIHAKLDDFEQGKMNKYKNKYLVLVCAKGLQSSAAAAKLQSQGFQCTVLSGGIAAWQNADLPLVKGKS